MALTRRTFMLGSALTLVAQRCIPVGIGGTEDADGAPHFGGVFDLGTRDEVGAAVDASGGFYYLPEARTWLVRYPADAVASARESYDEATIAGMDSGFLALYQKCPHLGCRVPECRSSQRFECPCHSSVFNRAGEWVSGPSPRGMDRFAIQVDGERLRLDTSTVLPGVAQGVATIDSTPAGPACVSLRPDT